MKKLEKQDGHQKVVEKNANQQLKKIARGKYQE